MYPATLELNRLDTRIVCVPRDVARDGKGGWRDGQWVPPAADVLSVATSFRPRTTRSRRCSVRCVVLVEWLLILCLLLHGFVALFAAPNWTLLLNARTDVSAAKTTSLNKGHTKTFDDQFVFALSLFLIPPPLLVGMALVLLVFSTCTVGQDRSRTAYAFNVFLHIFLLFLVLLGVLTLAMLHWRLLNFEGEEWLRVSQELAFRQGVPYKETLLGRIESQFSCCGIRSPAEHWRHRSNDSSLANWAMACAAEFGRSCCVPNTCRDAIGDDALFFEVMPVTEDPHDVVAPGPYCSVDDTKLACYRHVFFMLPLVYFVINYTLLGLATLCACGIIGTICSRRRKNRFLLRHVHASLVYRRTAETRRLRRILKRVSAADKTNFMTPSLYRVAVKREDTVASTKSTVPTKSTAPSKTTEA